MSDEIKYTCSYELSFREVRMIFLALCENIDKDEPNYRKANEFLSRMTDKIMEEIKLQSDRVKELEKLLEESDKISNHEEAQRYHD